ncbi:MAG TPA: GIY-YIG nuclease family protein, partial [Methylococcales bacterium]
PSRWKQILSQWRGVYYTFDASDGKAYVGSAYGNTNLLGRWENYAATGHGNNKLLRNRKPDHFQFSMLERVSPDMDTDEVIRLESSWKERLHTRSPSGLNEN